MKNRKLLFLLIPVALFLVLGFITMLLWNFLITEIFELKPITYLQANGLFLFARILFGRFGFGNKKPPFGNSFYKNKMMNMTDEQRQQFKQEWENRCKK